MKQEYSEKKYDILAIHVIGDSLGPDGRPPHKPLLDWLESNNIEHIVKPMEMAENEKLPMGCYRCSWNRRSTLFKTTSRSGCTKLAFGHHLDDMVETALMNLLYQGRIEAMQPCAEYFGGVFHLIRPLIYTAKKELDLFAKASGFPEPPPDCERSKTSKRKVIADIFHLADTSYQNMRWNVFRAVMEHMEMKKQMLEDSEEDV